MAVPVPTDRPRSSRPARWPALVALAIGLIGGRAEAGSTTLSTPAATATESEADHARDCRCATRCKGPSCCCAPVKPARTRPPAPAPRPAPRPKSDPAPETNPCVGSAPCGDPALPESAAPVPIAGKAANVAALSRLLPPTGRPLGLDRRSASLPPRRASRLDRPPDARRPSAPFARA